MIKHSATLAINEAVAARRARGERVVHLGFGEAGLPALPEAVEALRAGAAENSYGPVGGSAAVRAAGAGYFTRRGLSTTPEQVLVAPGSKALLYGALAALPGDLILPQPSWVTYAAQAALTGKRAIAVPIPAEAGGIPDPERLEEAIVRARGEGADPRILIATLPDNPTGTAASADLVKQVCEVAARHALTVISDEIYRDLEHDPDAHTSPAGLLPEQTIVTTGLSKSMALGGWRIGVCRLPDGPLGATVREHLIGVASEVWSSLAAPMQAAAAYILDEPPEIEAHVTASRRLHSTVAQAVYGELVAAGAICRPPAAAFYLYPDLEPLRPSLDARGIHTGQELADHLLDRYGVGVLAGAHFGDDPAAFRFRVATSLLYGSTDEERWTALRSGDPVGLPWITESIEVLRTALAALR